MRKKTSGEILQKICKFSPFTFLRFDLISLAAFQTLLAHVMSKCKLRLRLMR